MDNDEIAEIKRRLDETESAIKSLKRRVSELDGRTSSSVVIGPPLEGWPHQQKPHRITKEIEDDLRQLELLNKRGKQ